VRKYVRRLEAGAREPRRARVPGVLDGFGAVIEAKLRETAVQIYQDLCREEEGFGAS
jgi:hypothetical protein